MFDNTLYLTQGVNANIGTASVMTMCKLINDIKNEIEVDYLQVFDLEKSGDDLIIKHHQEVPEYKKTHKINFLACDVKEDSKVFVIDNGNYTTIMLAEEY